MFYAESAHLVSRKQTINFVICNSRKQKVAILFDVSLIKGCESEILYSSRCISMDEQYPKFVVDSRLARRRLARAFELRKDGETKLRFLPESDRTAVSAFDKNVYAGDRSISHLVRSITSFVHQIWSRKSVKRSSAAQRNITGCGFFLLLHLSEFAAIQTDNPGFWL